MLLMISKPEIIGLLLLRPEIIGLLLMISKPDIGQWPVRTLAPIEWIMRGHWFSR